MSHRWDPVAPHPGELVRPVRVDPTGVDGPTRRQAAARYWRRTSSGFYVPADTRTDLPEQRIMEQSARLPPDGAVTGWAACRLHRASFFDGLADDGRTRLPVPLNVGSRGGLRNDADAMACFHHLHEEDRATRYRIPTVTPLRATYDAIRLAADRRRAVVAIDMMAAAELMSLRMLADYLDVVGAGRSSVARWALGLASEHSRSPREVQLRLVWLLDADLPRPLVNCPVLDLSGRLLGIADLLDATAGLVVEFDGEEHRRAKRHAKDLGKDDRLRRAGLEVTRVSGPDLADTGLVVDRLLAARDRALFQSPEERRWVAVPPADDLHDRILVREAMREQHQHWADQPVPDIREVRGF